MKINAFTVMDNFALQFKLNQINNKKPFEKKALSMPNNSV